MTPGLTDFTPTFERKLKKFCPEQRIAAVDQILLAIGDALLSVGEIPGDLTSALIIGPAPENASSSL